MKFKAGDLIVGKKHNGYIITNDEMYKAKVIYSYNHGMRIQVLEHHDKNNIGESFWVENNDEMFDFYQDLKIGDFVKIREDLQVGKTYGGILFVSAMEKPLDYTVKIRRVTDNGKAYRLDDDTQLYYSREMLVKVDNLPDYELLKPGTKVVPHSKSTWCPLNTCPKWKEAKHTQGYLYVQYYDCEVNAYVLNVNEDDGEGNFYKREDFTLYEEPKKVKWEDINKIITLRDDVKRTKFKLQLNQHKPKYLLEASKDNNRCVIWTRNLDGGAGPDLTYKQLKEVHKLFGDIIEFVENNK